MSDDRPYLEPLVDLRLDPCEQQVLLLALGRLAAERPGWDFLLNSIALRIDDALETDQGPRASMYEHFRQMRQGEIDELAKQKARHSEKVKQMLLRPVL